MFRIMCLRLLEIATVPLGTQGSDSQGRATTRIFAFIQHEFDVTRRASSDNSAGSANPVKQHASPSALLRLCSPSHSLIHSSDRLFDIRHSLTELVSAAVALAHTDEAFLSQYKVLHRVNG